VLTLAASYASWVAASAELLAGLSAAEREMIFGGNARRFYVLGTTGRKS
jgi:L-fuconolactonase